MNCPNCNVNLQITERQGVEIDYCPQCRGVWLDRGELDKIIDRQSSQVEDRNHPGYIPPSAPPQAQYRGDSDRRDYGRDDAYYKKKKKKSFLDDIFDF